MLSKLQDEMTQLQEDLRILSKVSELISLLKSSRDVCGVDVFAAIPETHRCHSYRELRRSWTT